MIESFSLIETNNVHFFVYAHVLNFISPTFRTPILMQPRKHPYTFCLKRLPPKTQYPSYSILNQYSSLLTSTGEKILLKLLRFKSKTSILYLLKRLYKSFSTQATRSSLACPQPFLNPHVFVRASATTKPSIVINPGFRR